MSDLAIQNPVQERVAEKSPHVPITTEILVPAAQYGSLNLFRFLWNRCRRSSVTKDLINAATKNRHRGSSGDQSTFSFLLYEADCVEIGEATLIAIAAHPYDSCDFFDVLLEQGLRADTTEGLPKALLMNGGIKLECSLPTRLHLSNRTKITETMFKIAASHVDVELLDRLSKFCELESTPKRWLDIARLYRAVGESQDDILQALLESGVEPDVAGPDGATPLVAAAVRNNEEAVQILLSAGASPDGRPNFKCSPLCSAAYFGCYDIVKMVVTAGASLDFRNDKGLMPSMIAKSSRHILVFKYLEQSRMQQERLGRQTPEST